MTSIIPSFGASLVGLAVTQVVQSIFVRSRSIGGFTADVTIEERGFDQMVITEHPVEQGANIADHAFKLPSRLTIRGGFSNSSLAAGFDPYYVDRMYQNFLALQASAALFSVQTGKRLYQNMLMESLTSETTEMYENAFMFTVECKQIIIANTQVVAVPAANVMQNPQVNGAPVPTGTVGLTPAPAFNSSAAP